jgi:tellurite resistance protein TehA-like permease
MICHRHHDGMTALPFVHLDSPREIVRQFTPNWFAASMGTGIVALVLAQTPLKLAGQGLWLANIALFTLFAGLYAARWILFPHGARRIFDHPVMSMFLGCAPMALATT